MVMSDKSKTINNQMKNLVVLDPRRKLCKEPSGCRGWSPPQVPTTSKLQWDLFLLQDFYCKRKLEWTKCNTVLEKCHKLILLLPVARATRNTDFNDRANKGRISKLKGLSLGITLVEVNPKNLTWWRKQISSSTNHTESKMLTCS